MSFNGKVVLITGASSGIGADAARHFVELGAQVSIVGRNEARLNEVAEKIKNSCSSIVLPIIADVTKDVDRIVYETIKHLGKLDVLVNNAGIIKNNTDTADLIDFDLLMDTNVRAIINLTKLCVPHLEKTNGNIVNVSSIIASKAVPNFTFYSMTKAALDQFTKCTALDLAPKGIRVNSINPGVVRTGIFENLHLTPTQCEEMFAYFESKYPIGRIGNVSDTSAAIAFLADNKLASFVTGVLLPIDGGGAVAGV